MILDDFTDSEKQICTSFDESAGQNSVIETPSIKFVQQKLERSAVKALAYVIGCLYDKKKALLIIPRRPNALYYFRYIAENEENQPLRFSIDTHEESGVTSLGNLRLPSTASEIYYNLTGDLDWDRRILREDDIDTFCDIVFKTLIAFESNRELLMRTSKK